MKANQHTETMPEITPEARSEATGRPARRLAVVGLGALLAGALGLFASDGTVLADDDDGGGYGYGYSYDDDDGYWGGYYGGYWWPNYGDGYYYGDDDDGWDGDD